MFVSLIICCSIWLLALRQIVPFNDFSVEEIGFNNCCEIIHFENPWWEMYTIIWIAASRFKLLTSTEQLLIHAFKILWSEANFVTHRLEADCSTGNTTETFHSLRTQCLHLISVCLSQLLGFEVVLYGKQNKFTSSFARRWGSRVGEV